MIILRRILILSSLLLLVLAIDFWSVRPHVLGASTAPKYDYTIVVVGDSMTEYLGNLEDLQNLLKNYYPNKSFLLLNYGFSSTNILSLQDRLDKSSWHDNRTFQAINEIPFDLILIESFGHNPLPGPRDQGLQAQTQALDKAVATIVGKHPRQSLVFVATLAPNKDHYAEGFTSLNASQRQDWVSDRQAYIQNHINYARAHQIPLIDIYDDSMLNGTGNLAYINPADHIHPSPKGIYFISQEIAKFIYENKLLTN